MIRDLMAEREAPRVAFQCADDRKSGLVEIMQHEQRHLMLAEVVDERSRRRTRHAFGRHDGEVVALGEMNRLEQRQEAFLLDEQHGTEAATRSACLDASGGESWLLKFRCSTDAREIVANADGAESDRIAQCAAR